MFNLVKFLLFIFYATIIFFLPNNTYFFIVVIINILIMILAKVKVKDVIVNILKLLPFILFTFIINIFLDNFINALWVALKLIVVCNITFIYSKTITVLEVAKSIKLLCAPFKILKINTNEIEIMICISLSMIPILIKSLSEIKNACKAKNIDINLKNMNIILSKLILSFIRRVNEIDEALLEKGYYY